MALYCGRVGATALEGARHDAGVGAEGIQLAEVFGVAEFAGEACGKDEADARDAGEHDVRGGGEGEGSVSAEFDGVALKALIEIDGGGKGALADVLAARRAELDVHRSLITVAQETARAWAQLSFLGIDLAATSTRGNSGSPVLAREKR